jgi:hypothetical protein
VRVYSNLLARLWTAIQARRERSFSQVIIDEAPRFLDQPTDLGDVLARSREYGVDMTLIGQGLRQFPESLREVALNIATGSGLLTHVPVLARTPHLKCPFIVTRYTTVFPPGPLPPLMEASAFCWVVTTADIHADFGANQHAPEFGVPGCAMSGTASR